MLLKKESPLINLPRALPTRDVLLFDGIRYAVEMIGIAYIRLLQSLVSISEKSREGRVIDFFQEVFLDAWSAIDSLDRLRGLLKELKSRHGTVAKDPLSSHPLEYQQFMDATETVRELRNKIQHINNFLDHLVKIKGPVWGNLHWVHMPESETGKCYAHTLVAGALFNKTTSLLNTSVGFMRRFGHIV